MAVKLPKQIWFFWGNEKMSFLRYMTLKSFAHYNPDWQINLIVPEDPISQKESKKIWDEEQDYTYYDGADYTEQAHEIVKVIKLKDFAPDYVKHPPNIIGDLLKWLVLGFGGGVFSDMDILFVKPFPYIKYNDIQTGIYKYLSGAYPAGFLIGNRSPLFQTAYFLSVKRLKKQLNNYQDMGPLLLRDAYWSVSNQSNITFIPNETVYPFINGRGNGEKWQDHLAIPFLPKSEDIKLPDECFGIHWYGGCQAAKQYNAIADHNTYKNMECLITREIKRVIT